MLTYDTQIGAINAMVFTPGGMLVTGGMGKAQVWQSGELSRDLGTLNRPVWSLDVSPDGRFVVVGGANAQLELSDRTGERPQVFNPCPAPITGVAFLNNKRIVVTLGDRSGQLAYTCTLYLVDLPKVELKRTSFGAVNGVRAMAVDPPRSRVAWATDERQLMVQDIARPLSKPVALRKDARVLAFSPSGRWLVATSDWDILVYDLDQWPTQPTTLGRHRGTVTCLAFTPDGRHLISGSSDETIKVWSIAQGLEVQQFSWQVGRVTALAISHDGLLAAVAGESGKIAMWDLD